MIALVLVAWTKYPAGVWPSRRPFCPAAPIAPIIPTGAVPGRAPGAPPGVDDDENAPAGAEPAPGAAGPPAP